MSRVAPAWLRPIGRVFPRVVITHAQHATLATHVASLVAPRAIGADRSEADATAGADRSEADATAGAAEPCVQPDQREPDQREEGVEAERSDEAEDSGEDTFSLLSVRSLSGISCASGLSCLSGLSGLSGASGISVSDDFAGASELSCLSGLPCLTGLPSVCLSSVGLLNGAVGLHGLSSVGLSSVCLSSVGAAAERTYEDHVRFIARADAETMQRRHVTGEGVYYFPRFSSATEERRAQKAPRRACIELGETVFSFGTLMCDGDVELTFLGHRVARTRRGDFNARVERRGSALVVVAVDQILVFREIIVDGSWMDDL